MSLPVWWAYFVTVFLVCAIPGPNMLHVMVRSARLGARRSLPAMAGLLLGLEIYVTASAVGLGAVITAFPPVFDAIRYVGAAYLIYLGVLAWRAAGKVDDGSSGIDGNPRLAPAGLFRTGLMVSLSNPKAVLAAAAILPQFMDEGAPKLPQFAIMIVTFAAAEMFWYAVYATGGQKLGSVLSRPALRRTFDRITGGMFVGFGIALFGARV